MNAQIYEEAAQWLVELNGNVTEADSRLRERFYDWLRTSPEHVRAYLELLPAWEVGAALPADGERDIAELLQVGKDDTANVVPLSRGNDTDKARSIELPPAQRRKIGPRLAIAASLLLICVGGTAAYLSSRQGLYATDTGEQRIVRLVDGSTVELNSRSKVRVRFSDRERQVELLEGQALFEVAHDTQRPFVVMTDRTQVRAVGTEFDVNIKSSATVVTVVEGKVLVRPVGQTDHGPPADPNPNEGSAALTAGRGELLLQAGEQLTVASANGATLSPRQANVDHATAWTQRHLVFDDSTLKEVIEEFNRYNTRQLVLKDASLADFPITAAFESLDPTALVRFLRAQPDIEVEETPRAFLISKK